MIDLEEDRKSFSSSSCSLVIILGFSLLVRKILHPRYSVLLWEKLAVVVAADQAENAKQLF